MTQLGAQMFTVREFTKDTEGLLETFRKLRAIGYEAVQVSAIGAGIPVQDVAEGLKENGLTCAATHISFDDCKRDLDAVIDASGIRLIAIVPEDAALAVAGASGSPAPLKSAGTMALGRLAARLEGEQVPLAVRV